LLYFKLILTTQESGHTMAMDISDNQMLLDTTPGLVLRHVNLPEDLISVFLHASALNTSENIETLGYLLGRIVRIINLLFQ